MKVRPVLAKNCFSCHTNSKLGGLDLSTRQSLLKGGKSGPAVVPGDPSKSLLFKAVRFEDKDLKMPMGAGKLKSDEIAAIETWIKDGAIWPDGPKSAAAPAKGYIITPEQKAFWSFQPVRKPAPPAVKAARTNIDRFILAKLEEKKLKAVPRASRTALLRRATIDLTGLPPTPEEVDAFVADKAANAFEKVIDRLLASPRYGERWGRYWLDVARYSDDKLNSTMDEPAKNAFRFRDWVIDAFNHDMPYDTLVKAQIAGDLLKDKDLVAGTGMYALSPEFQDDRVDVTTRGFLGMTVACAQCHDHKYDPIPTKDFYSLLGVFTSSKMDEYPLAEKPIVDEYKRRKKIHDDLTAQLKDHLKKQSDQLAEILSTKTADYLQAVADGKTSAPGLDTETIARWAKYLNKTTYDYAFENPLKAKKFEDFEKKLIALNVEKIEIDEKNNIRLGGSKQRGDLSRADLLSLERDKYFMWRELFGNNGVLIYSDKKLDRWLSPEWKSHVESLRAKIEAAKTAIPEEYPFLHAMADQPKPHNEKIQIKGSRANLGAEAPREFMTVLCNGDPKPFTKGSGRLELAEAIASKDNPLTARVMVNRIWLGHFGQGIVRTPDNFGVLGDRPSHQELLDYLAARFMENNWSMKSLHKEIMLSDTYALSTDNNVANAESDPENRLLWRANVRRLEAEALRDSILFVAGDLDLKQGGPGVKFTDDNHRRTVYGYVSRRKLDPMLSLFDFPNPNSTSEQRIPTDVPTQRLFLLNSPTILKASEHLAAKVDSVPKAYRMLFGRAPTKEELKAGTEFLAAKNPMPDYLQVLMSSNEFLFVY